MACQVPLPWHFPGRDTGMGYHFLLQGVFQPRGQEPTSPALAGGFFTSEPPGKPITEHYRAKKKEGSSATFTTTRVNLEDVMLSEKRYSKMSHDESKIVKLIEAECLPRAGGGVFKKVQSFSYTKLINLKDLLYSIMPIVTIVYLKICYDSRSHMTYSIHKITNNNIK